jgi:ribosomal protein S18 acetylase RimI-like enzyme
MSISVFLAGPDDAALFGRVHADVFDTAPGPDLTARFLAAPHPRIAVAVSDGMIVGMCSGVIYHHPDKPPQWWVNEIGVAGLWRPQGLATRLVAACTADAMQAGCTEVWVISDPTDMAEGFWQSLGWERTGQRLAMFSHPLPDRT